MKLLLSPEQAGYAADDSAATVRIPLDGGPSAMYADLIGASSIADLTWVLDPSEYEALVNFYTLTLHNGTDEFELDLILDDPLPLEYQVKFVPNTFQLASQSGLTYTVTAQVEVLKKDIDAEVDEYIIVTYPDQGFTLLPALSRLANVVMPGSLS